MLFLILLHCQRFKRIGSQIGIHHNLLFLCFCNMAYEPRTWLQRGFHRAVYSYLFTLFHCKAGHGFINFKVRNL